MLNWLYAALGCLPALGLWWWYRRKLARLSAANAVLGGILKDQEKALGGLKNALQYAEHRLQELTQRLIKSDPGAALDDFFKLRKD